MVTLSPERVAAFLGALLAADATATRSLLDTLVSCSTTFADLGVPRTAGQCTAMDVINAMMSATGGPRAITVGRDGGSAIVSFTPMDTTAGTPGI